MVVVVVVVAGQVFISPVPQFSFRRLCFSTEETLSSVGSASRAQRTA